MNNIFKAVALLALLSFVTTPAIAQTNTVTSTVTSSNTVTGTTTVDKTPPTASAPNVVVNNQDVCTTAVSAAVQTQILGVAGGTTIKDLNCERLKLSRALYGMGMKVAAVSMLCQDPRVFNSMEMAGTPCPYKGKIGIEAANAWANDPEARPDYDEWLKRNDLVESEGLLDDKTVGIGAGLLLLLLL